jgi:hypothetical protein
MARKDIDAQLLFQFNDGFGDAGLRGVKGFGSFGQIEISTRRLLDEAELV